MITYDVYDNYTFAYGNHVDCPITNTTWEGLGLQWRNMLKLLFCSEKKNTGYLYVLKEKLKFSTWLEEIQGCITSKVLEKITLLLIKQKAKKLVN